MRSVGLNFARLTKRARSLIMGGGVIGLRMPSSVSSDDGDLARLACEICRLRVLPIVRTRAGEGSSMPEEGSVSH
jgi:hypothetical protein